MEVRMISEVRTRPVLWDVTLDVYKKQDLKQGAWDEVASNIGCPELSGALAARWKNIRETFTANMKRIRESKRSGCGTDDVYVPKWSLFKYLDFLKKTCAQANSESNIPECTATVVDSSQLLDMGSTSSSTLESLSVYFDDNTKEFHAIPEENINASSEGLEFMPSDHSCPLPFSVLSPPPFVAPQRPASAPVTQSSDASTSKTQSSSASTSKPEAASEPLFERKGSGKNRNYTIMEEAVKVLKEVVNQPPPVLMPPSAYTLKQDAFDQFAAFVASRLRSMDPTSAKDCENKILEVLLTYN